MARARRRRGDPVRTWQVSETPPFRIVILGGGTAGWMTACLFAKQWRGRGEVIVIESPDIGIIGVGEGSTPQMKAFFDTLGIAEAAWMPACDATYKLGIRFDGWSAVGADYFHPFPGPLDLHTQPQFVRNAALRRAGVDVPANPDLFYLAPRLADAGMGPHPTENFPFEISYGYHFDAFKVGAFLRDHAVKLGVTHLPRKVDAVRVDADGQVTALILDDGEAIAGDFFVDCSGFRAMIAEGALGVRFLPFADNLFNDRAVVMPTPHADGVPLVTATGSSAMSAGWRWTIPLTSRVGNGYVFSSRYIDPDAAEAELRSALGVGEDVAARHLQMKVGRLADSWTGNCLAMGLAQGFIEPLEATALHIVMATAQEFIAAFEGGGFTAQHRSVFNQRIAARYEGIRDYIVAHYRMNQRTDAGEYWRDAAAMEALSDDLKAMITAWFTGADLDEAIAQLGIGAYYGSISWHCLFAGYGVFPDAAKMRPPPDGLGDTAAVADFLRRASMNFALPRHGS
ncbi:MAG: tryptophan 7-halogenase [Sphingopyxis sp.]|nr:tryptophan 7-halogenase [Sphingopyxis sp.]